MERIPSAARLVAVVVATMLMALPRIALACDGAVTVCPEGSPGSVGLIVDGRALPIANSPSSLATRPIGVTTAAVPQAKHSTSRPLAVSSRHWSML